MMNSKTTIQFNSKQIDTLKNLMQSIAWLSAIDDDSNYIKLHRPDDLKELVKNLEKIFNNADSVTIEREGPLRNY